MLSRAMQPITAMSERSAIITLARIGSGFPLSDLWTSLSQPGIVVDLDFLSRSRDQIDARVSPDHRGDGQRCEGGPRSHQGLNAFDYLSQTLPCRGSLQGAPRTSCCGYGK